MGSVVQHWESSVGHFSHQRIPTKQLREYCDNAAIENNIQRPKGYKVSFHYNNDAEKHHFGRHHPMKPWRLQLTKNLILSYGLNYAMDVHQTRPASLEEMEEFHKDDYLEFLHKVTPDNMGQYSPEMKAYHFDHDCPVFDGMFDYCSLYTGASMDAAHKLISNQSNIAINWSGGLHHAKKASASGFCYINDIVLAILEMLRYWPRVLYIDIDVHHGDGVEQAFASSDRVLTLSLHKYGLDVRPNLLDPSDYHRYDPVMFFPGTGNWDENGPDHPRNPGAHHSLNIPLYDGIDDHQYHYLFKSSVDEAIEMFKPSCVVLQCGADSLGGDLLGKFNLNIKAHGDCVEVVKRHGLPLLLLGGGGYTPRNVARAWCHETALAVGAELKDDLPAHVPYRQAFETPENGYGKLYPSLSDIEGKRHPNEHNKERLHFLYQKIHEELRYMKGAPSVQMQELPRGVWELREQVDREMAEKKEDDDDERRVKEKALGSPGEYL